MMNDSVFINLADKRHTWAFGAIAELIHNSSDAEATEVRVSLEHLGPDNDTSFAVIDNGHGMTHQEMGQLFTVGKDYGHDSNAPADERIGCNGMGFKQGVLRLENTAVVVSVRGESGHPFSESRIGLGSDRFLLHHSRIMRGGFPWKASFREVMVRARLGSLPRCHFPGSHGQETKENRFFSWLFPKESQTATNLRWLYLAVYALCLWHVLR